MSEHDYERVPEVGHGLRLHLNEHTGGCSPHVLAALRAMTAGQIACYPDYAASARACASYLGVASDHVLLTNGLDEGILAAAFGFVAPAAGGAEALVVLPAFDMYAPCAEQAGARLVAVPPRSDFAFPRDEVMAAITPATRLVFLTSPNNPTGQLVPREAIREVARRVPAGAVVFLDEAYGEFSGQTFLDELAAWPNVVVGRTFSKAFGLAGLRIGALVGAPATLAPVRRIVPPYSLNACAVAALGAALQDLRHMRAYVDETWRSRELLYAACRRLGLDCWPSAANFVLVRAGHRAAALVDGLARRGIFVRDRSAQPGCAGCVRITAGLVADTERCIAAMEEVLCGAP